VINRFSRSRKSVETTVTNPDQRRPARSKTRSRLWVVLGIALALAKVEVYRAVFVGVAHHPREFIVILPVAAAVSLLAARPVAMSLMLAPLVPLLLAPGSALLAIGIGVGAFLALVAACVSVGTLLGLRDARASGRRSRLRGRLRTHSSGT
jgi:hypothetical protein